MPIDFHKYKAIFLVEATSFIKIMNDYLLELEKNPEEKKFINEIQRATHSLKGLASTMDYTQTVDICHKLEDLLGRMDTNQLNIKNFADLFFKCFDFLENNFKQLAIHDSELNANLLVSKLESCIRSGSFNIPDASSIVEIPITFDKLKVLSVSVDKLDKLMNLAEELLGTKMKFDAIKEQSIDPEISPAVESLGRLISDLQYDIMQIRLVPIEFIFNRFLRMTRDLAKQQHKEVNILIEGNEIELDRLLIDELGESLVHLVRNAIDHGLEMPEVRRMKGKPTQGTITLRAERTKDSALIEIHDDGAGLDLELIKNLAIEHKIINTNPTNDDVINAIFSNLSTKENVTTISGRGLGLFIVKNKIESLGGNIRVKTQSDIGTSFYIEIPLSLAIIRALFVQVAQELYAIPIDRVERLLVVNSKDFKGMLEYETIIFGNTDIPITRLSEVFKHRVDPSERQFVVIIQTQDKRLGLVVDGLLSTQEIVVKPLGKTFKNNKFFSGAALVSSGKMVLILDVAHLFPTKKMISNLLV